MLGKVFFNEETGLRGKVVNKFYLYETVPFVKKMYLSITLDRTLGCPIILACKKEGTSFEDLAEKFPDMITKVQVDFSKGLTDEDAAKVVDGLAPIRADRKHCIGQVKLLWTLFDWMDCTLLEINPIAEASYGRLVSVGLKMKIDDNAAFRRKTTFDTADLSQEDPGEVAAAKVGLNYIVLSGGDIGCVANGAGLAMATMDLVKLHGGTPANFLDIGVNASDSQVVEAFKILASDWNVKAILVNIFGGIIKCDILARGIVEAKKKVRVKYRLLFDLKV